MAPTWLIPGIKFIHTAKAGDFLYKTNHPQTLLCPEDDSEHLESERSALIRLEGAGKGKAPALVIVISTAVPVRKFNQADFRNVELLWTARKSLNRLGSNSKLWGNLRIQHISSSLGEHQDWAMKRRRARDPDYTPVLLNLLEIHQVPPRQLFPRVPLFPEPVDFFDFVRYHTAAPSPP